MTTTVIGLYAQDRSNPGELALALHATTPGRLAAVVGEARWPEAAVALEVALDEARIRYFAGHSQWADYDPASGERPPPAHVGHWRSLHAVMDCVFLGWCHRFGVDARIEWVHVRCDEFERRRFENEKPAESALRVESEPPPRIYRAPNPPDDAGAERAKIVAWLRATHPAGCGSDYAASQIERGAHLDTD